MLRFHARLHLRRKLRYALEECITIDADETTNARIAAEHDAAVLSSQNSNDVTLGF